MTSNPKSGFTLAEILIVVALMAILFIAALSFLNPWTQISKANDSKRKNDLTILKNAFEEYYNDNGSYPSAAEVCIDPGGSTCEICGEKSLNPYLSDLPCDPEHPRKSYRYRTDSDSSGFSTSFRIYTNLDNKADPVIHEVGCSGSICGPNVDSNYGVSSPNTDLEGSYRSITPLPGQTITPARQYVCCTVNTPSSCNVCGDHATCVEKARRPAETRTCKSVDLIFPLGTPDCNDRCQ